MLNLSAFLPSFGPPASPSPAGGPFSDGLRIRDIRRGLISCVSSGLAAMDEYPNYAALSANEREGVDYRLCATFRNSPVAIIAPHGGRIERRTSDIAAAIAGDSYALYCFEGTKPSGNSRLHITSVNFDEPRCLDLIATCDVVVAAHGLLRDSEVIDIGGRNIDLEAAICQSLKDAGFAAEIVTTGPHGGTEERNICNRGRSKQGVQLEIPSRLRDELSQARLVTFADAVRQAIIGSKGNTLSN